MPTSYTVAQGDSLPSIGFAYGFAPDTLWNHSANADLKALRGDPNVLLPGDVVTIPDKRPRQSTCEIGRRHVFRRMAVPATLRVQFYRGEHPRANEACVVEIDGRPQDTTQLDDQGSLRVWMPPGTTQGRVLFHDGTEVHELAVGHLDPVTETSGLQGRLRNLGWYADAVDGQMSDALLAAIQDFQAAHQLEPNGIADDATRAALVKSYGE